MAGQDPGTESGSADCAASGKKQRGRSGEKQRAVLDSALTIFARDGYTRASIDAIAADAEVSTRTIYNYFQDKAGLFHAVILMSAARFAEAQIAIIDRYLRKVTDVEADLIAFGEAWVTPIPEYADHVALVRQINAEAGHIPQGTIDAWQEMGPLRVRRELARHLQQLADRGLLRVEAPERAALHFSLLISTLNPSYRGDDPRNNDEQAEVVAAGVRVFLYGYHR